MAVTARSLGELVELVERGDRGAIEYRGRLIQADRLGMRARFVMSEGLQGTVRAEWPRSPLGSEDGRSALLHALNSLVQRCAMFETCERAYARSYGRRTA